MLWHFTQSLCGEHSSFMTFWQYFFLNHQAEIKQSKKVDILNTEVTVISDGKLCICWLKYHFWLFTVLPIFGPSAQKRSASGTTTIIHRDSPTNSSTHTRTTLSHFLARLRDNTALAVVISLLARLHNVLRDEPSLELNVEYAGLWPAVVSK